MKGSGGKQRVRLAGFAAVALAATVMFAALGGVGLAQTAVGLGQYQYGKKVTICHKGKRTIRISVRAWPAHKRHGDAVGTCEQAAKRAQAKKAHAKIAMTHGKKAEQGKAGKKAEQGKAAKQGEHGQKAGKQKSEETKSRSHGKGNNK